MDWAGTAVDYGCFAPVSAFIESFNAIGISITAEEARRPMGLTKIDHIRALFQMERIGEAFYQNMDANIMKLMFREDMLNSNVYYLLLYVNIQVPFLE